MYKHKYIYMYIIIYTHLSMVSTAKAPQTCPEAWPEWRRRDKSWQSKGCLQKPWFTEHGNHGLSGVHGDIYIYI